MNRRSQQQVSCAVCGGLLPTDRPINVEPLIDPAIRYVYVHWDCHSFVYRVPATS